jgi:hypothetical protein
MPYTRRLEAVIQPSQKDPAAYFPETIIKEKHQRVATEAMRDLMLFNNALESEIRRFTSAMDHGRDFDTKMLALMSVAKERYNYAMSGFNSFEEAMQRYALCMLADAIQDLMFYVHNRRKAG